MAKTHSLKTEPRMRTGSGVLKQMRREGYIPSVVYGGGAENRNVKVSAKAFRDLRAKSASDNILVELELDGGGNQLAFLKAVQQDPLTDQVLHVDFLAVSQDTEITAQLPVELIGEAEGIKLGGQLEQLLYDVEIKCLPKNLPETITATVDQLEIGDALHVGDIQWPEGVSPTLNDDVVVALVAKPRVEEVEEEETGFGEEGAEGAEPSEDSPASEE